MPGRDGSDITLGGDLAEWLDGDGDETRELIVDARTPPRVARLEGDPTGNPVPGDVRSAGPGDRAQITRSLRADLTRLVDGPATLLEAAGAVVVRANREQLRA